LTRTIALQKTNSIVPVSARRIVMAKVLTAVAVLAVLTSLPLGPAGAQQVPLSRGEMALSFAPVVKAAAPAVVNVYASRRVRRSVSPFMNDPFFRRFFGDQDFGVPRERVQSSLGSGVILSPDGIVVTNNHVIAGADDIKVALADRREFAAEVILKDERADLAVLRIVDPNGSFPSLQIGDSDALQVGDLVLAIGNPFGVGQTVTSGIVSALARTRVGVADFQSFIQTDAAINPGNSGGALVDMSGRLVGINTAIFSRSGGSNGIGFAVPANMVKLVVEAARGGTTVKRPWFGAKLQAVSSEIAETLGMDRPRGVLVTDVYQRSPAAKAGLKVGDVLVSVEGLEVTDPQSFNYRFATRGLGGQAAVEGLRAGTAFSARIELAPAPEDPPREERLLENATPFAGAKVANLSPAVAEELDRDFNARGVVILDIEQGSRAASVRFRRGDIIREVNGFEVDSVRTLTEVLRERAFRWDLVIEREGRTIRAVLGG
jgi:Do/DeqQ family serine protease